MSAPILTVRNLKSYYGPITAIRGVSFDVGEGQIVTILGANGAGKTTILKSVCGAMEPQKGTVSFGGRSCCRQLLSALRRGACWRFEILIATARGCLNKRSGWASPRRRPRRHGCKARFVSRSPFGLSDT